MNKTFNVATELQRHLFSTILMNEIKNGFWKDARPTDHGETWDGVNIRVATGTEVLGAYGFDIPRNYNFVNPAFFKQRENALLEAARIVDAETTVKQLKKQLIQLNQIVGNRVKEAGGPVSKLARGRRSATVTSVRVDADANTVVRRAAVNTTETA